MLFKARSAAVYGIDAHIGAIMDEEKLTLQEQGALMCHEDIRTTLGYGGKAKAETVRGVNARVVEMLRKRA